MRSKVLWTECLAVNLPFGNLATESSRRSLTSASDRILCKLALTFSLRFVAHFDVRSAVLNKTGSTLLACLLALLLVASANAAAHQKADLIVVKKSESRLYLERKSKTFASFKAAFGADSKGHKQQEGDERTPEGIYAIDWKHANSGYYKALHISYPNAFDVANAKAKGMNPGGAIMIHGQKNGWGWIAPITQLFDWTNGCIALNNRDMEIVFNAVDSGTKIDIRP